MGRFTMLIEDYDLYLNSVKYVENSDCGLSGAKKQKEIEEYLIKVLYPMLPYPPSLDTIDTLSAATYEHSKCENKNIVFLPYPNNLKDIIDAPLDDGIKIEFDSNIKSLRKIINPLPRDCCYVFCMNSDDSQKYYAVGSTAINKINDHVYYRCTIINHMKWILEIHFPPNIDICLLGCVHSRYNSYKIVNNNNEIKEIDSNVKNGKFGKAVEQVNSLFDSYCKDNQRCGTSVVIFSSPSSPDEKNIAASEADRLASDKPARGYKLKLCKPLENDLFRQIINIDGGIIIDTENKCYAYGCIFDGIVNENFDGEREVGARHNSMKLYVNSKNNIISQSCIGLVFSEDGGLKIYE